MVYLIASILIHGILFTCTGLTFIPHAQYSVQPSTQMVEVSFEQADNSGETLQNKGGSIKSSEKMNTHPQPRRLWRSVSGVKVKASPDYFQNPPPEYSEFARQMRQEGIVMLSVDVNKEGYPVSVEIIRSSGFRLLDQAALKAVRYWRFQPGSIGSVPIESTVTVPIRFRLEK